MSEEPSPPSPESSLSALAAGVFHPNPRHAAVALANVQDPNLTAKDGAEAAVSRFCEQAFVNPESARAGSAALLEAFDDSGLWLANLVHPHQLLAELRQSCSTLTRVIITQWTRQGETHKLVRLGTALMEATPPVTTHEAGQIGALLASLLGILRPQRAQDLLEFARPLLKDSIDPHLLREARDWVEIGSLLESAPAEDRFFWNRRLREPEDEWDWDTTEARAALRRLAPILLPRSDSADLSRFQQTVPGCWWDLLRDGPKPPRPSRPAALEWDSDDEHAHRFAVTAPLPLPPQAAPSRMGIYAFGVLTGLACMALVAWLNATQSSANQGSNEAQINARAENAPAAPSPAPKMVASAPAAPAAAAPPRPVLPPVTKELTKPTTPQAIKRQAAVVDLAEKYPHLERQHHLAATGSIRENEALLAGQSTLSQNDYQTLIRWLMLDPPEAADVRLAVAKVAARVVPPKDLLPTLTLCIYPSSVNAAEARQCARWALILNQEIIAESDRQALEALNAPLAQNNK